MPIKNWSTTAASNNSAPPNGAPENWAPSAVNDTIRQQMADHRTQWQDAEWFDWGDTPSRASASSFKIGADVTSRYLANRRIKLYDATTLYATISSSSYSAPDTTVNVTMDSGSLTTSLTSVALAILSPTNKSIPSYDLDTLTVSGASQLKGTLTASGAAVFKTTVSAEGNTTLAGTLTASGASVFKTTVNVEGASSLSGNAVLKGTLTVEGATTLSGAATLKSTLAVEGALIESKGTASSAGRVRLYEDSDNGTNYVEHIAAASIAANRTVTWPDTDISFFPVQQVRTSTAAVASGTTTMPLDDSIPENTEGDEYMTLAITPKNSNNILVIEAIAYYAHSANDNTATFAFFQDTTVNAIAAGKGATVDSNQHNHIALRHYMTAGTTSATTFKFRVGNVVAGTTTINGGSSGNRHFGGVSATNMIITEYSA
jgi:hypothetical protein